MPRALSLLHRRGALRHTHFTLSEHTDIRTDQRKRYRIIRKENPSVTALDWFHNAPRWKASRASKRRWVLKGTLHAVSVIFENLKAGANIEEIMEWFDGLDLEQSKPSSILPPAALNRLLPLCQPLMLVLFDQALDCGNWSAQAYNAAWKSQSSCRTISRSKRTGRKALEALVDEGYRLGAFSHYQASQLLGLSRLGFRRFFEGTEYLRDTAGDPSH